MTHRITKFIDETLDAMLERPGFWGDLASVELQVVRLLEVRALATDSLASYEEAARVHDDYLRFLAEAFPSRPACLLADLVGGDLAAFKAALSKFRANMVDAQQRAGRRDHLPIQAMFTATSGLHRSAEPISTPTMPGDSATKDLPRYAD